MFIADPLDAGGLRATGACAGFAGGSSARPRPRALRPPRAPRASLLYSLRRQSWPIRVRTRT